MQTIVSVLQTRATHHTTSPAFIFLEEGQHESARITYDELDKKARIVAAFLQSKNLKGERVLLLYPPGLDFIIAFTGCLYAGVTAIPLNFSKQNDFDKSFNLIQTIAQDAEIAGVFAPENVSTYAEKIAKDCSQSQKVFSANPQSFSNELHKHYHKPDLTLDTVAYLQYTSGSTSAPKAAIITHKNLNHTLKQTTKAFGYTKKSVTLTWAPHSHVYGLVCGILVPLFHGSLGVLMPVEAFIRRPLSWLEAITTYHVTQSGCPNFGYDLCVKEIQEDDLDRLDLQSWKFAINGGEAVQYETLLRFSEKFKRCGFTIKSFCPAFGMSEATGAIAVSKTGHLPLHCNLSTSQLKNHKAVTHHDSENFHSIVSNGKLLPGLSVAIVDPDTLLPVAKDRIGEVWLAGDAIVQGYWHRPEETKASFGFTIPRSSIPYFRTGDLGFVKDDCLYLTGRQKEMIVVYGEKYYPLDLETVAGQAVADLGVNANRTAFSCAIDGKEQIVILQEIKPDMPEPMQQNIIKAIRQAITRHFGLDIYGVCLVHEKSIPKTSSGKLQRKVCQRQFLDNQLRIINQYTRSLASFDKKFTPRLEEDVSSDFIKRIASVLGIPEKEIDLNAPVDEYGFDSINLVKLSSVLNDHYHIDITPATFFEFKTLAAFFNTHFRTQPGTATTAPAVSQGVANDQREIAIIGLSCRFPGANDATAFWKNLEDEVNSITDIPAERWDHQQFADNTQFNPNMIQWGGFLQGIAEFDAAFFNITRREAELIDPQQRLFLQEVWKAIEDAGYSTTAFADTRTGLFVGVFHSDYEEILKNQDVTDAYLASAISHSTLANRVSFQLNLRGPSEAINTACSSSLVAIHSAIKSIQQGDCEVAIVGGVNALLTPTLYLSAAKAGMLSADGRCKAFDKDANGYVRSEGIAAIILKPLEKALADHDHIYGVIKASAVNHGGHVNSLTVPNPIAQAELITTTYERAKVDISSIGYIEAHGTGTPIGDPIEINGLKKAFAELQTKQAKVSLPSAYCGIGSVKSNIGHTEAAAGIAGVIKVLLAMRHGKLPASLHFNELNPYIDITDSPFYIVNKTIPWKPCIDSQQNSLPRRAGVSSFGFGGTNAHLLIEESLQQTEVTRHTPYPCLITLSAKTETALQTRLQNFYHWLTQTENQSSLSAISYTLNAGRNHFTNRCFFVVASIEELLSSLEQVFNDQAIENGMVHFGASRKESLAPLFREVFTTLMHDVQSASLHPDSCRSKLLALGNFYVQGYDLDWEALQRGQKSRISLPTYPFAPDLYWYTKSAALPVDRAGKQSSQDLRQTIQQDLIQFIAFIAKITPAHMHLSDTLSELGFDSIAFKELAVRLENHYSIRLTPSIFFTYTTIAALSQYLLETYSAEISGAQPASSTHAAVQPATDSHALSQRVNHSVISEPIAIIGMQGLFPQSRNVDELWEHLQAEHDLITEIPSERWRWQDYYTDGKIAPSKSNSKWGGFIPDVDTFDAGFFNISSREANFMDPQQRLFMETVWKTMEDAGYDPLSFSNQRVGVFAGVEFNEYQIMLQSHNQLSQGYVFTGNSHAMLANRISYFLNLRGPSEVIDATCASSLIAVNRAIHALRAGECESAVAGGVSLMLNPDTFVITSQLNVLSPDGHCKTFDKSANGYVKGEGVGAILLKPLSKALQDNDHIYAVIKGSAENHGGKGQSLTAPNTSAQKDLLIQAYSQANIASDTVTYLEAHGTGTELGDPIEIDAMIQAFSALSSAKPDKTHYCALGSIKTNIGHLEPASGIAGIIKVLLSLKHQELPAMLHFRELNPYINLDNSPFFIVQQRQAWKRLLDDAGNEIPRRAGISSFGVGGSNAHVILEEFENVKLKPAAASPSSFLVTLSAKHPDSLQQKIRDLHAWLLRHSQETDIESLSYTLNCGRSPFDVRCALIVGSIPELIAALGSLSEGNTPQPHANPPEHLRTFADAYLKNQPIDWSTLYPQKQYQRVAGLPSYPFIKKRYWFDEELKISPPSAPTPVNATVVKDEKAEPRSTENIIPYLQTIFATVLRLSADEIDPDSTYERYGVDSMIGLEIIERLEQDFGNLPRTLLYERNQLRDLAAYLQKREQTSPATTATQTMEPVTVNQDVAIVGLSGAFPLSEDIEKLWENLVAARDCITEIPADRWDYKDYPVVVGEKTKYYKLGGFLPDIDKFDPLFFNISPYDAALMDPQERLFLQTTWATLEDAGYTRDTLQRTANNNVGVFAGVTYNFYPLFIAEEKAKGNVFPLDIQLFSVANRVSYFLNLNGPSFIVDTACSSSLAAIHLAYESIVRGECKMAIAGGVNLSLHPAKYHMLGSYSFLSDQGRCASFAAGGSGYVPSEGVAAIILKPLAAAIQDGDRIYGVIKASQMNHGGKTSGYSVPNPNAQADLIKKALIAAKIDPRTISYIEAHGTGTSLGDPIEIRGLQEAFEAFTQDKQFCAIGSIKSNIGHLESAAGISQIAKVLLQMRHQKLVPSIHAEELNPFIDFANTPFFVQRELSDWQSPAGSPRRAGVNSFGAGGTNIHMIIEEYIPETINKTTTCSLPFVYLLSATTADQLKEYVEKTHRYLTSHRQEFATDEKWLAAACYTSQVCRESLSTRLAIMTTSYDDLLTKLKSCLDNPQASSPAILFSQPGQTRKIDSKDIADLIQHAHMEKLADGWIAGVKIAWDTLYANQAIRKVFIPTYPFAKRRCWIVPEQKTVTPAPLPAASVTTEIVPTQDYLPEWLYKLQWQPQAPSTHDNTQNNTGHWIIFSEHELGIRLQEAFGPDNCSYCFEGEKTDHHTLRNEVHYIRPDSAEEYSAVITRLFTDKGDQLKGIIYLWDLDHQAPGTAIDNLLEASAQSESSLKLLYLFQALIKQNYQKKLQFCLVSRGSQPVTDNHPINLWQHHLWSLTRVFATEQPNFQPLLLDLDIPKKLHEDGHTIVNEIKQFTHDEPAIAYRGSQRYVNRLAYYLDDTKQHTAPFKAPETALITGGLGALGFEVVTWLAKKGTRYLLLTGNTRLPDRSEWSTNQEPASKERIDNILALEKSGVQVIYAAVDVADKQTMQQVIAQAEKSWQKTIQGVFHLAGITTDSITIDKITPALFRKVLSVKIQGSLVLHDLFQQKKLDCFVLFSSIAAVPYFGMSGLSAYAMANAFMDGFAAFRRRQGLPATSINWAAWADKGMSFRYNHSAFLDAMGMSTVPLVTGIEILDAITTYNPETVGVFHIIWNKFLQVNPEARKLPFFANFNKSFSEAQATPSVTTNLTQEQIATLLGEALAALLGLNLSEIDFHAPYQNYGLDSIIGINFVGKIGTHFPNVVSPMDLYRYPNVMQLANFIYDSCHVATTLPDAVINAPVSHATELDFSQLSNEEVSRMIDEELKELGRFK